MKVKDFLKVVFTNSIVYVLLPEKSGCNVRIDDIGDEDMAGSFYHGYTSNTGYTQEQCESLTVKHIESIHGGDFMVYTEI